MTWFLEGRPLHSVLVSRLRYLGDIAMATVVLEVLRRGDPTLEIGFLCEEPYAPALAGQPSLRRVHPLRSRRRSADARARTVAAVPTPRWPAEDCEPAGGARVALARGAWGVVRELRTARYDLAVDLFFNPRSAVLLRLSGCRLRVGGKAGWRRRLYTHLAGPDDVVADPVFRRLAPGGLGDHLSRLVPLRHGDGKRPFLTWLHETWADGPPRPRLARPPLGTGAARQALERLGIAPAERFLLLAPGATWPTKEWPMARWGALVGLLQRQQKRPLVVLAPPLREAACAPLATALAGGRGGVLPRLPLAEALRLVAAATAIVSVDGGIMHAAVAMGRPTLALFGPTAPEIWFPYEDRGRCRVLARRPACHPCDRHACEDFICLPAITAEEAAEALLALLAEAGSGS